MTNPSVALATTNRRVFVSRSYFLGFVAASRNSVTTVQSRCLRACFETAIVEVLVWRFLGVHRRKFRTWELVGCRLQCLRMRM